MGHSVGEYAALVAGGAFALRDAALVLRARGAAMRDAAMQETQVRAAAGANVVVCPTHS